MKKLGIVLLMSTILLGVLAPTSQAQVPVNEHSEANRALPAAPTLVSPPNGATLGPGPLTWTWNPVPGAACYHLQAGSGTNFGGQYNIIDRGCITGTSYTFNVTSGFIVYFPRLYWHVQARTTTGLDGVYGPWSETWGITFKNQ